MLKVKRNNRQRRLNKQNIYSQGDHPSDKRILERGAKDRLTELSDITEQFIALNSRKVDLSELCAWNEDVDEVQKPRPETRIGRLKKSEDLQTLKQSKSILKRKYSTTEVKTKISDKKYQKHVHTEGSSQIPVKSQVDTEERISDIIKSISSRPSNLFPHVFLKQTDRSSQYTAWRNARHSLPNQIQKTNRQSHIKVYPSFDTSQTNFNKIVLKCKQSTLHFKIPPKEIQKQMVKYIGDHAVFVKCRERFKYRFQQNHNR